MLLRQRLIAASASRVPGRRMHRCTCSPRSLTSQDSPVRKLPGVSHGNTHIEIRIEGGREGERGELDDCGLGEFWVIREAQPRPAPPPKRVSDPTFQSQRGTSTELRSARPLHRRSALLPTSLVGVSGGGSHHSFVPSSTGPIPLMWRGAVCAA